MNKDIVVLEFNQEDLNEYLKYYFKLNPRKKKLPVESPMARSLNKILIITNRMVQNTCKQNIKDYVKWIVKKYELDMLGISKTDLHIHFTFPTKIRHDLDNYCGGCKEIMDGLSQSGMIIDDDYSHIKSLTTTASYEKGVTKMVFTFTNCKYDLEELKIVQAKELEKSAKKKATMEEKKKLKNSKAKK